MAFGHPRLPWNAICQALTVLGHSYRCVARTALVRRVCNPSQVWYAVCGVRSHRGLAWLERDAAQRRAALTVAREILAQHGCLCTPARTRDLPPSVVRFPRRA